MAGRDRWLVPPGRLAPFLDARGLGEGRVAARSIGDGRSNATLRVTRRELDLVLRRPPAGDLPAGAHDVLREARVLRALEDTGVPVPRVVASCEDPEVIGAPFVLTERIAGTAISATMPFDEPGEQLRVGEQLVDALAAIHAQDPAEIGLANLGRPDGYLERQVRRHLELWERYRTRDLPLVAEVGAWLKANLPAGGPPTLVHGDYRLGNAMFGDGAALAAILDWELSTLGDPLADLGYLCACWTQADDDPDRAWQPDPATRAPGCPTRAELAERYAGATGRDLSDLAWYEALALWRGVVFMEGNHRRAKEGLVDDPYLLAFGEQIPRVAELAHAATRRP